MRETRGYVRRRCRTCGVAIEGGTTICTKGHKVGREGGWGYVLEVTAPGGKRRRLSKGGYRTKTDAERALGLLEQEKRDGTHVEVSKILTGEYLTRWVEGVHVRESTRASYELHTRRHLIPAIGDTPLQALDRAAIKRAYAGLVKESGEPLKAMTVHHVHTTLHKALEDAVEDRLISRNPADRAHKAPMAKDKPEHNVWSESQMRDFLESVRKDRLYALWRLTLMSGARRGELIGLKWSDVDLAAGTVTFTRQRSRQGKTVVEGATKTGRARRTIDIDQTTIDGLIEWQVQSRLGTTGGRGQRIPL
jgi:integrase